MADVNKYRTIGHDIAPPPAAPVKPSKIGEPPQGRLGVYRADGVTRVGHVGPHAGPSVVARFLGHTHAVVTKIDGRPAWRETGKPRDLNKGAGVLGTRHDQYIKQAKGSVTHSPSARKASARPRRG